MIGMVKCLICGREVPADEYSDHWDSHHGIPATHLATMLEVCLICGGSHLSHKCPFLPKERRDFVYDIASYNDLMQILFENINKRLGGPVLGLEIYRVPKARYAFDAYAGIPGKVILTINDSKEYMIEAGMVAASFIHEILHQKYPELEEEEINEITREKWDELYKGLVYPLPQPRLREGG